VKQEPAAEVEKIEKEAEAETVAPERPVLKSEHPILSLEEGESPGKLHLVLEGAILHGDVMDLSLDGCILRLSRPYELRTDMQVEVDFNARGLPFRLPGLTKEMHDAQVVEVRFTAMSRRKGEDLSQVISELIERAARKSAAD
jgi:hypothetical protein